MEAVVEHHVSFQFINSNQSNLYYSLGIVASSSNFQSLLVQIELHVVVNTTTPSSILMTYAFSLTLYCLLGCYQCTLDAKNMKRKRRQLHNANYNSRLKGLTVKAFPDCFPVCGSQHISSPDLLPLTRYLPSGDHPIQRTQFLCPV